MDAMTLLLGCTSLIVLLVSAWMALQVWAASPDEDGPHGPLDAAANHAPEAARPSIAVLVPAHNEAGGLADTLRSLMPQLLPQDRLLVVADNCTDATAQVARQHGAEVLERFDLQARGKGHALAAGFALLDQAPRDVLVIVDADCLVAPGALQRLSSQAHLTDRPAQALYLMTNLPGVPVTRRQRFSEFAWRLKNWLRPLGLKRLGLPCQLMGSGMAFPWHLLQRHSLASGHLVEDMQLGLALAKAGHAPRFCPQALVTSLFPTDSQAQARQRTRWEHGHLSMITQTLPGLLRQWLRHPRKDLLAMALDVAIPPLSLLALVCAATLAVTLLWALVSGATTPLLLAALACALFGLAIWRAWQRIGQSLLSPHDLLQVAAYLLWKLPLYARFLTARQLAWVRSQRHEEKH